MLKSLGKSILFLIIVIVLFVGGFLLYMTITDYKPEAVIDLKVKNNSEQAFNRKETFSITTFNMGYAGLDQDENFFMDGGEHSRAKSKDKVLENLEAITAFLKDQDSTFNFVQEVDQDSSRSYHVNEVDHLEKQLPGYSSTFGQNYLVPWVPVPVFDPMGSVDSGILTLSKYKIDKSKRYQLYGQESWPRQLFELDRCAMEDRIHLDNGKDLVLLNVHLSAYDKGGKVRKQQLIFLNEYMKTEKQAGNYLIIGGDWNLHIPNTDPKQFATTEEWPDWLQSIPKSFDIAGYQWVADPGIPTVRSLIKSYKKGENFVANIDGFLVSENIEVIKVTGHNLEFEHSDHNPVTAVLRLK